MQSPTHVDHHVPQQTGEGLADVGRLLAQTLDRDLVARRIAEGARALLDARAAWLYRVDPGGALGVIAATGEAAPTASRTAAMSEGPAALAARERRLFVTNDVLDDDRIGLSHEARNRFGDDGVRAALAVPMVAYDRVVGVLVVADRLGRTFTVENTRLAEALADHAAVAFENARLYDEAERRRVQTQETERRSTFLAEASGVLASSLDYETTLAQVARLAVPGLADVCAVDVLEESGGVRRLAVAYDEATVNRARASTGHEQIDVGASALTTVLRSGRAEFYPEVTDEVLGRIATDDQHRVALRALGLRSLMVVPLTARGRRLGAITFVSTASGRPYGAADLAFVEDLATRSAQAIDNSRLYRSAQAASRAKDEFLATVSHELRTPLTAILGWARVLRARATASPWRDAVDTIERNARAQAQIINDLLDVSRVITGMLRLHVQPVDLVVVIHEAVAALRPAIDAKALQLITNLDPAAGPFVGDGDRLQQVVWNLLSNAVKFTPAGGRIDVRLSRADDQTEIVVTDSGLGITAEFLPYVFERFRQAETGSTRAQSGLGLGLAIVRHIVELHGGTARAESDGSGRGATFVVTLPVAAVLLGPGATPAPSRPGQSRERRLQGVRVLVVEDDADARDLFGTILSGAGAAIETAASADEAREALHVQQPDVLVCDLALPTEDGYRLIQSLHEPNSARWLPAIAVTASTRREDRQRALDAGFQAHLAKPVDPTTLIDVVSDLARAGAA